MTPSSSESSGVSAAAKMPCRRAFKREIAFPSGVLTPAFSAFSRFAATCAVEAIAVASTKTDPKNVWNHRWTQIRKVKNVWNRRWTPIRIVFHLPIGVHRRSSAVKIFIRYRNIISPFCAAERAGEVSALASGFSAVGSGLSALQCASQRFQCAFSGELDLTGSPADGRIKKGVLSPRRPKRKGRKTNWLRCSLRSWRLGERPFLFSREDQYPPLLLVVRPAADYNRAEREILRRPWRDSNGDRRAARPGGFH